MLAKYDAKFVTCAEYNEDFMNRQDQTFFLKKNIYIIFTNISQLTPFWPKNRDTENVLRKRNGAP